MSEVYPLELDQIITNPNLIFVFDNVLGAKNQKYINSLDWGSDFWVDGWTYNPDFPDTMQVPLATYCYKKSIELLNTLDPSAKIVKNIGSYWVNRDDRLEGQEDNIHRDYYDLHPQWSVLFHFVGNGTGPTCFFDKFNSQKIIKKVDFVPGRMILFPGLFPHRATNPTPGTQRVTHSIRYILDTKLNKDILKFTPELEFVNGEI